MRNQRDICLMIGGVREDYCITHDGRAISGILGGNAIYAAVGARLWSDHINIVSRVGSNFPHEWFETVRQRGISTSGIRILDEEIDTRTFYAYRSLEERIDTNPPAHYARWGLALPKELNGYRSSTEGQENRTQLQSATVRITDIPGPQLTNVAGAHLSPTDYLTHLTIPSYLQGHGVKLITLDPSIRYMTPSFKLDLPSVLQGITAFLPSVYEATAFAPDKHNRVWELADIFHNMGPSIVVIKAGANGQYLSDRESHLRWHVPAYPSEPRDVTGAGDAFCGAFLVNLLETQDPLEATMRGNISASFVIEGSGALYALDTPTSLVIARLEELRHLVRKE
jgi:sugar/nucleoside kinase (ribokinase family)